MKIQLRLRGRWHIPNPSTGEDHEFKAKASETLYQKQQTKFLGADDQVSVKKKKN
jgi:hypothetical protein